MNPIDNKFTALVEIIKRLRQPDGCPWDIKQDIASFTPYLMEETHELLEAIDNNDIPNIKEELGDLFFQLIFINNLYEEKDHFTLSEVLDCIAAKMVRRHPHVFGDRTFASEIEMRANWNRVKAEEKGETPAQKSIFSLPKTLPALLKAQKVSESAAKMGFEWPSMLSLLDKIDEEVAELKEAIKQGNQEDIREETGDLLFAIVNLGRLSKFSTEDSLARATDKFIRRFEQVAQQAAESGREIHEVDIDTLIEYWKGSKP